MLGRQNPQMDLADAVLWTRQLQAATERRQRPDFPALMAKRPAVERKQAHLNRKGRRSRYIGLRKTRLLTVLERHRGEHRAADVDRAGDHQPGSGENSPSLTLLARDR